MKASPFPARAPAAPRGSVAVLLLVLVVLGAAPPRALAVDIPNAGFETGGPFTFNEFTFGAPAGWSVYDPSGITGNQQGSSGVFLGTLEPGSALYSSPGYTGVGFPYFGGVAPEGDLVAILFNTGASRGAGEYGIEQALGEVLSAHTRYELRVQVGNIDSGRASNNTDFDLSGFPGYRVELFAGSDVLASDSSLLPAEGQFLESLVSFETGVAHASLGAGLGIRLVNLNVGGAGAADPDLEVDFDDVRLSATALAEPGSVLLLATAGVLLFVYARDRRPQGHERG